MGELEASFCLEIRGKGPSLMGFEDKKKSEREESYSDDPGPVHAQGMAMPGPEDVELRIDNH